VRRELRGERQREAVEPGLGGAIGNVLLLPLRTTSSLICTMSAGVEQQQVTMQVDQVCTLNMSVKGRRRLSATQAEALWMIARRLWVWVFNCVINARMPLVEKSANTPIAHRARAMPARRGVRCGS
jgi:hypothetical protein